ncbi:MAG: hypothetical protein U1A28_04960 [Patescibacteria group bacterium]|nr:hypothetical protein [Patescibacteria group bacterium]
MRGVQAHPHREFLIALAGVTPFNADNSCTQLADWVQLRNMLSHEYLDYRFKEISAFLAETEPLFLALLGHVKQFLGQKNRAA